MIVSSRILLVEDEEIIAIIIQDLLVAEGYQVTLCTNGLTAWERLQADRPGYDLVLLDRGLLDMDGIKLLHRIKNDPVHAHIPVIIETAQADQQSIRDGLTQGAYYYVTKPFQAEVLLAVVIAALQQSWQVRDMIDSVRQAERTLVLLQTGSFRFRDLEEGGLLANYLARACPEPERAILGLHELLVNAVEHGNLGISYNDKSELILEGSLLEEIRRRLQLPEYRERNVEIYFQRQPDSVSFTIQDQGNGFNWEDFLDFSPERAFDLNGRGIAMARSMSFDHLEYQGNGNTVIATINLTVPEPGPSQ